MATAPEQVEATEGEQQEISLRDTLDEAFEKHATDEVDEPRAREAPAGAPAGERVRDEQGRFAPAKPDDAAGAQPVRQQQGTPQPRPGAQPMQAPAPNAAADLKPPASWRPEVREKWGQVPPEVRQEIYRREYEAQHLLQETAGQRQFVDAFQKTVAPYEMFIREENVSPLVAVQNLMQAAATLRVGTPQVKAQLVANIIGQHGVSIDTLDRILAGMNPQGAQQAQQQFHDPRIDQFLAQQNAIMQQVVSKQDEEMRTQLSTFAGSHEFYTDVAAYMADIVESRAKRNEAIDLEKIYQQACRMHDGVSTILSQRGAGARSNGNQQAVLRARRAAVSIKGDNTPHDGGTVPRNDSIRASLEAAFDAAGN